MGQKPSKGTAANKTMTSAAASTEAPIASKTVDTAAAAGGGASGGDGEYYLKKRHAGCTGMFWRADPTGATKLASNNDWPRDGSMVRGVTVAAAKDGAPWLLVSHVRQAGQQEWVRAPAGAALPFEYDNHYYLEK